MRLLVLLSCCCPFVTTLAMETILGKTHSHYTFKPPQETSSSGSITMQLGALEPTHQVVTITSTPPPMVRPERGSYSSPTIINTSTQLTSSFVSLYQEATSQLVPSILTTSLQQQMMSLLILLYYAQATSTSLESTMNVSLDFSGNLTLVLGYQDSLRLTVRSTKPADHLQGSSRILVIHKIGTRQLWERSFTASSKNPGSSKSTCKEVACDIPGSDDPDDDEDDRSIFACCCCFHSYRLSSGGSSSEQKHFAHNSDNRDYQSTQQTNALHLLLQTNMKVSQTAVTWQDVSPTGLTAPY